MDKAALEVRCPRTLGKLSELAGGRSDGRHLLKPFTKKKASSVLARTATHSKPLYRPSPLHVEWRNEPRVLYSSTKAQGDGPRWQNESYDHIARIWPDHRVDCHSVAYCCAHRLLPPAFQTVAGRCHDDIHDTRRGRDGGHRCIDLGRA